MSSHDAPDRRAAGEQVVREMFGEDFLVTNMTSLADGDGPMGDTARIALEQCFGEIWSRPGLDRRSRSLVTLGVLMAQGHQDEIRNHAIGGLANGLTPEELQEAVIQTIPYLGLPAAGQAMASALGAVSGTDS